jgi:class 3 adenylate cyclase
VTRSKRASKSPLHQDRVEPAAELEADLAQGADIDEAAGAVQTNGAEIGLATETFTRLSRIVTDLGGEVHRYVGDALIATWRSVRPKRTLERSNA